MLMAFSKNKKVDLMWANTHSIKRSSIRIEVRTEQQLNKQLTFGGRGTKKYNIT